MDFSKLIMAWRSFRNDVSSMETVCKVTLEIKNDYEKIDSIIDCLDKKEFKNIEIDDDFYSSWEQLYKLILNPSHFFEIDQIITVFLHKEKILKSHIDIRVEDVESFSLLIMALKGLKNSWENYLPENRIPQPLSQYNILIGEMYSFFNTIFTEPEHQETTKELSGIETALFSLQSMMTNFQIYEKMIDSANSVDAEITLFKSQEKK